MSVRVERLEAGDEARIMAAAELFDEPPTEAFVGRWLSSPTNHLLVAYEDGEPAGFVSGVEVPHPDKPVEMLLYELGVRESSRRRGIARALVGALRDLAAERGCVTMWVLTDADNEAALRTYRSSGAGEPTEHVMLEWSWNPAARPEESGRAPEPSA